MIMIEIFTLVVGWTATVLVTFCNIPQLIKIIKTNSSRDISFWFILLLVLSHVCWITYGVLINDAPLIVTNSIGIVVNGSILTHKCMVGR